MRYSNWNCAFVSELNNVRTMLNMITYKSYSSLFTFHVVCTVKECTPVLMNKRPGGERCKEMGHTTLFNRFVLKEGLVHTKWNKTTFEKVYSYLDQSKQNVCFVREKKEENIYKSNCCLDPLFSCPPVGIHHLIPIFNINFKMILTYKTFGNRKFISQVEIQILPMSVMCILNF